MPIRYLPVVRTKAGEADALGNLSAIAKTRVLPVIRLGAAVPATFLPKMINNAAGMPLALDGVFNFDSTGNGLVYQSLFNSLGGNGFPMMPVVSMRAQQAYNAIAAGFIGSFAPGFVLHVLLADLPHLTQWVGQQPAWNPAEIDVLIDVGGVAEHNPVQLAGYVSHTINASIPANHPWRSVTLHAWSAPKDVGQLTPGRNDVARRDWQVWNQARNQIPFQIDYSDSGHVHPSLDEVPGYVMGKATVSARYTVDDDWIIHKGVATTGPNGVPMSVQYRGHAITLQNDPAFGGIAGGCWGDARIQHYATTTGGTGGRKEWAAVLLNRHISLVADRLP